MDIKEFEGYIKTLEAKFRAFAAENEKLTEDEVEAFDLILERAAEAAEKYSELK